MLGQLLESRRKRERNARGVMASAVVHAAIIGTVWHATAGAKPRPRSAEHAIPLPVPAPVSPASPHRSGNGSKGGPVPVPVRLPALPPRVPPVGIPPVGSPPAVNWDSFLVTGADIASGASTAQRSGTGVSGRAAFSGTVDVMARPFATNLAPVYPSSLRSLGVEGTVSVQFVVDTSGRVNASSITFLDGGNALFEQSVRQALGAARFAPALVGGHRVPVLVGQAFQFRIER